MGKIRFYWGFPLLIAGLVAGGVLLLNWQVTTFRESYFTAFKEDIQNIDMLAVEICQTILKEYHSPQLEVFFSEIDDRTPQALERRFSLIFPNRQNNPLLLQISENGGQVIFQTRNIPKYLQDHLETPQTQKIITTRAHEKVTFIYNEKLQTYMAYHAVPFSAGKNNYVLTVVQECGSISKIVRFTEILSIVISAGGTLLCIFLLFFVLCRVRSPLRRLQISTKAIAEGQLDYPVYVPKSGTIREIALAVSDMAFHLRRQIQILQTMEIRRRDFTAAISHAMKTPLTAILSAVEGIESGALNMPEYRQECLTAIKFQSERLTKLLHDFLTLTALEAHADSAENNFVRLSLNELLFTVTDSAGDSFQDTVITLTAAEEAEISGDPNLLEQAFDNLLANAVSHGRAKKIEIALTKSNHSAVIDFRNNGKMISPEELPKLFERFYRGSNAKHSNFAGNGLGLPIVRQIVESHHGSIRAASTPEWTVFSITIPLLEQKNK